MAEPNQTEDWSGFETPEVLGTPNVRGAVYGPAVGEFHYDAMFGPSGNRLGENDVALSPDLLKRHPLNSKILANGKQYTVADVSYISPGRPNKNTIEFRDRATAPARVDIMSAPGEAAPSDWSAFEDVKPAEKSAEKPSEQTPIRQPTEVEAATAPRAVAARPLYQQAYDAVMKGNFHQALSLFDVTAEQAVKRALNLPTVGDVTGGDVIESANKAFEPTVHFESIRPTRETVDEALKTPVGDLSKIPIARDAAQAVAEMPADIAEFFSSPGGVASMGVGMLPKMAQALIGAGFTTQQVTAAIQAPDNVTRIKNMLFAALGVKGTFDVLKAGVTPEVEKARAPVPATEPETAAETPTTVTSETARVSTEAPAEAQPVEAGKAPKLLPGETQGDLISSTQGEPLALTGEEGTDYEAIAARKKAAAEEKAKAEEAQTIIPFDEWGAFDEPSAEEMAGMKAEYEAGLLEDVQSHQVRGGDELLDAVREHGIPSLTSKFADRYSGELANLRGFFQMERGKSGFGSLVPGVSTEKLRYYDIFKPNARGDLDALTQHLRLKGFDVEDISDTLNLIDRRLRTGLPIYGDEARAEAMANQLPDSAFPNVGFQSHLLGLPADKLYAFGQRLNQYRKGFMAMVRARPQRDMVAALYDRISNHAAILGDQAGNEARLAVGGRRIEHRARVMFRGQEKPNMDEQAIIPVIQSYVPENYAGGDGTPMFPVTQSLARSKLIKDAKMVINSPKADPALKRVYQYAVKNFDRLDAMRPKVTKIYRRTLNAEQSAGINTDDFGEGYVNQRYDMDLFEPGKPIILDATGGKGGASTYFQKQRVFPDYATAIAAGYQPKAFDIATLVNNRVRAGQTKINQRLWSDALRTLSDPISGKPLVTDLFTQPKGTQVAPEGYTPMELPGNIRVAVNDYFASLVRGLTSESHFPKVLSKTEAGIKHGTLLADTFHLSRLAQMQGALTSKVSYRKGLALLEYSDAQLGEAVARNEITQPMADYARTNRSDFNGLVSHGLNVGQITDALYRDIVQSIPGIGSFNKFLFDKYNRGIIAESGLYMLERNRRLYPDISQSELFRRSAREANTYYRNLRSQGLFKRKTWQDTARFFLLAPQWLEGGITSELLGYGQLAKIPIDAVTKQRLVVGNIARGMGRGILTYMVGTQLINMLTRGHPTWENPEDGEKWSAWVPDVLGDSNGFFLNPMGVFGEMTHDMMKYAKDYPNQIDTGTKIIQNKYSPVSRAIRDVTLGKDFFGRPLDTIGERAMQAGVDLLPIPIAARSLSQQYAGSQERTLSSSLGFKLDVAPSAGRQISLLAREFNAQHGIPPHQPEPSQYRDLRDALRRGDMDRAQTEYDKMRSKKDKAQIRDYFDRISKATFTGSQKREHEFRRTLERQQLDTYNQAVEDAKMLRQRFLQLSR